MLLTELALKLHLTVPVSHLMTDRD